MKCIVMERKEKNIRRREGKEIKKQVLRKLKELGQVRGTDGNKWRARGERGKAAS